MSSNSRISPGNSKVIPVVKKIRSSITGLPSQEKNQNQRVSPYRDPLSTDIASASSPNSSIDEGRS